MDYPRKLKSALRYIFYPSKNTENINKHTRVHAISCHTASLARVSIIFIYYCLVFYGYNEGTHLEPAQLCKNSFFGNV